MSSVKEEVAVRPMFFRIIGVPSGPMAFDDVIYLRASV